ncbi:MAG: hypothetical protein COB19_06410 [Porticoccus sp.]|nr:MAG: hypothetical protein COB19_06410 [Porticoccus sp.]
MKPMMRKRCQGELSRLQAAYPGAMTLRISLDHHTALWHDLERGEGAFDESLKGMRWLRDQGIKTAVAGRGFAGESEAALHGEVGRYAAEKGVSHLLAIGPLSINTVREFGPGAEHLDSKEQLLERLQSLLDKDAVVLVKGSRFMAMDTVVKMITELGEH